MRRARVSASRRVASRWSRWMCKPHVGLTNPPLVLRNAQRDCNLSGLSLRIIKIASCPFGFVMAPGVVTVSPRSLRWCCETLPSWTSRAPMMGNMSNGCEPVEMRCSNSIPTQVPAGYIRFPTRATCSRQLLGVVVRAWFRRCTKLRCGGGVPRK